MMEVMKELNKFFNLEGQKELFNEAISPKSCGGTDQFKFLAFIGDNILNLSLISIYSDKNIINSGILTKIRESVHNEYTLSNLGKILEIDQIMVPLDSNHSISDDEIKESVEALLGACYNLNGFEKTKLVVEKLVKIIESESLPKDDKVQDLFYKNFIGILLEYSQKIKTSLPLFEHSENLGFDHDPRFYCNVSFEGITIKSDLFMKKDYAKRDAAQKMLVELGLIDSISSMMNSETIPVREKKSATNLSYNRIITFDMGDENKSYDNMPISVNTGELLADWARRKGKKNPFGMLLVLSARVEEISGSSWIAEIDYVYLALIGVKINDEVFYEVGYGPSKSKAKKDAGYKIIENIGLYELLDNDYGEITI